jgi:putative ABC transport system ATP-binding protein
MDASPPKQGDASSDLWSHDRPSQPAPAVAVREDAPAFALDRIGLQVDGDGLEGSELLSWHGQGREIANIVGGSQEERQRLLAVIAGRLPASVGCCRISGHDLWSLPPTVRGALRHRVVGSVLSGDVLIPHLNLRENIALPLLASAVPDAVALEQAQHELARLGLAAFGDTQPALLWASQTRLAHIAIALVHRPRLCVLDAPEESLNDGQIAMLGQRLLQAARVDGACVVLSTEHPRLARLAGTTLSLPKQHAQPVLRT